MLSLNKLSSSAQAASYYQKADYYTTGEEGVDIRSEWLGEGAKKNGLEGEVTFDKFKDLLDGKLPDGTQMGTVRDGKNEHTPGWDLTFSAPKSVSLLALLGGDKRLISAHQESVKAMSAIIEDRYLIGRRNHGKDGVEHIKLQDMVAAMFTHTTSRDLDPQLHSHMVLLNMAKNVENDKDLSIYSKYIFKDKMFLGQIYRNELAKKVLELGYKIDYDPQKGTFEIAGVDKELLREFSQRRQTIEATAEAFGYEGGKEMEKAALYSRDGKKNVDRETLLNDWTKRLNERGYTSENVLEEVQKASKDRVDKTNYRPEMEPVRDSNGPPSTKDDEQQPKSTLRIAVEILSHYESAFDREKIEDYVMKLSLGEATLKNIGSDIKKLVDSKYLIPSDIKGSEMFTTPEAVRRELYMLDLLRLGRSTHGAIADDREINRYISEYSFTEGQERSFKDVLKTPDRYIGLQGYAGVGKTYMLKPVIEIAEGAGYTVRGLAPHGTQAEQLQKDTGLESNTLKSHLIKLDSKRYESSGRELWVVDEAGLVNTKDMVDLLTHAHRLDARVIFSGDSKQLNPIEAGSPFDLAMKKAMDYTVNDTIIRQTNKELKDTVYDLIDRKTAKAFMRLRKDFRSSDSPSKEIIDDYLKKEDGTFSNVALIVPDIETRDVANNRVREELRDRGMITGKDIELSTLRTAKIDGPMKKYAFFYKPGQVVRFMQGVKTLGVEKNDYLTVEKVENGIVTLKAANGREVAWNPMKVGGGDKTTTTYEKNDQKFAKGDRIRWKDKTDSMELKNGHIGEIKAIGKQSMTVVFDGRVIDIDLTKKFHNHFELAYAQTVYSIQGQTFREALVLAESWRRNLVNLASFYVSVSRAKESATIYTDDVGKLRSALDERLGLKENALTNITAFQAEKIRDASQKSTVDKPLEREAKFNEKSTIETTQRGPVNADRERIMDL